MTEGRDGGGLVEGVRRRRRVACVECMCDWCMQGEERMKEEIGSIFSL